ncbi:lyase family protein [Vulcanisaeta thermophila]|uniref:lyase family protein n=1 Tax=Vulcanisaeta thermophila TaxID=867917 RepID=UPI000853EFF6|nr:lyase family protein [Vulcanisaeta thermophila]
MYRRELLGASDKVSYISSVVDDAEIFREVLITMMEHVNELERARVINPDIASTLRKALREILAEGYEPSKLTNFEDVHEYVESRLMEKVGPAGGWVGIGRSRNDHVTTAIRLRLRRYVLNLAQEALNLRETLLNKAAQSNSQLIIGSTHRQPAQVTTLGHYMLYLDDLTRDFLNLLMSTYSMVNKSPLGSGPLAGTMVNLDRAREAQELGFDGIVTNTIYATGSRFFIITTASLIVDYLVEVGRFINNLEMWLMPQLNYVKADPKHLATSSIMPHKRNPATLEVFRARVGEAVGHLMAMYSILRPVEAGYQLDLQELTRHLWAVMRIALEGLTMLRDFINSLDVNDHRVIEDLGKYVITAAEYAEVTSMREGRPFREVYNEVARAIREGARVGLEPQSVVLKPVRGSSNPRDVVTEVSLRINEVRELRGRVDEELGRIDDAENRVLSGG